MPVAVRNATKTVVILSNPDGESLEWQYAGHPDGADVIEVSEEVWASAKLRRAKNRGILAETTPEALEEAYAAQRTFLAQKNTDKAAEIQAALSLGTPDRPIVISATDMEEFVGSKVRDGEMLERAMADTQQSNPMAVVNAAAEQE
jgi:hypothetical protein